MEYDETNTPSSSCQDIKQYLTKWNQLVAISENWLPKGGRLCQNDFSNVLVFREPMSRILSHYKHLFHVCNHKKSNAQCQKMLLLQSKHQEEQLEKDQEEEDHGEQRKPNLETKQYFNVTYMMEQFDILSDNYYVRSLNNQSVYKEVSPLLENELRDKYFHLALKNLRSFDWIILLQSDNDKKQDLELKNTELIIQQGLALYDIEYPHSRHSINPSIGGIKFASGDYDKIAMRNQLDLKLWEEARRLNSLDVSSLRRLKDLGDRKIGSGQCCGSICNNHLEEE